MNKVLPLIAVLGIALLAIPASVSSGNQVNVIVFGYIAHGPMQSTIDAIRNVTAKYGNAVNVTWIDLNTQEGQQYSQQTGLSAHMNILINGAYEYTLNGKTVTFQWFEGGTWTQSDLDAVISSLLNNSGNPPASPAKVNPSSGSVFQTGGTGFYVVAVAALIAISIGFYVMRRDRKTRK
jgi:hypothetical protein